MASGIPIYGTGDNAGKLEGYGSSDVNAAPYFLPNTSSAATPDNSQWSSASSWNSSPTTGGSGQNNLNAPTTPSQPTPGTPIAASATIANAPTPQSSGQLSYQQAQQNLNSGGLKGADLAQATQDLKTKYNVGLTTAQNSSSPAPDSKGAGSAMVQNNIPPTQPTQEEQNKAATPPSTPQVDSFFTNNAGVQQSTQDVMDFLSPQSTKDDIFNQMQKVVGDQDTLAQEQLQLMNDKNIMAGTPDDLRTEITKAGGFATESQVQALAVSRNAVLLKQASFLQDQMQYQQSLVANDTSLLNFEKDMANTQFSQRMGVLQYQQTNQQNMRSAALQSFQTIVSALGYDGAYQAYQNDPQQLAAIGQISGLGADGLKQAAIQATQNKADLKTKSDLELQQMMSSLQTDALQRKNIQSEIDDRNANAGSGGLAGEVLKQNTLQNAADQQTVNSNYQQIQGLFPNKDLNSLTAKDVGGLSQSDQITVGKALARIQNPDVARAGGDPGNALAPVGAVQHVGEFFRNLTGQLYAPDKVLNAIKTANSLYNQRNNIVIAPDGKLIQIKD